MSERIINFLHRLFSNLILAYIPYNMSERIINFLHGLFSKTPSIRRDHEAYLSTVEVQSGIERHSQKRDI